MLTTGSCSLSCIYHWQILMGNVPHPQHECRILPCCWSGCLDVVWCRFCSYRSAHLRSCGFICQLFLCWECWFHIYLVSCNLQSNHRGCDWRQNKKLSVLWMGLTIYRWVCLWIEFEINVCDDWYLSMSLSFISSLPLSNPDVANTQLVPFSYWCKYLLASPRHGRWSSLHGGMGHCCKDDLLLSLHWVVCFECHFNGHCTLQHQHSSIKKDQLHQRSGEEFRHNGLIGVTYSLSKV